MTTNHRRPRRDEGAVLPLVLLLSVVMALVVVALADYASSTLELGKVAESSADRLATANGAMDNALEDIQRNASICLLFGQNYSLTDTINGIKADITCDWGGNEPDILDDFALIITGDGAGRTGPLLTITNAAGTDKIFEGPVYMASPPSGTSMDLQAPLTIKNGDLYYSSSPCPGAVAKPANLTITPAGYTLKCRPFDWFTLFQGKKPPEPPVTTYTLIDDTVLGPDHRPDQDANGCYVWPPGRYTTAPSLANQSYNYFASGDYYFDNLNSWTLNNAFVLMGWPGASGPGIDGPDPHDTLANNPCRDAWNETDHSGAAVYLGGNSRIQISQGSTFEVSGKSHGDYVVGIQALEAAGVASSVHGNNAIVSTGSGSNKQISIQGLVWAPYAAFVFDLVSNEAVAALTGGAVIGELSAGASASANNFLIAVGTQPTESDLILTATAVKDGSTSVKTVLKVRSAGTSTSYAVQSRRILQLTPE
jgi:hypothetical protein